MSRRRARLTRLAVLPLAAFAAACAILSTAPLPLQPRGAVLANVTVINPGLDRAEGRTLRIAGDRIESIEAAAGSRVDAPFSGAYVIPGLIDMHVHFPPETRLHQTELFAFLFLDHGVTTVRDAADIDGTATAPAREGIRSGAFPGPRIFACGPLVDGPAPIWKNSLLVSEPGEAAAAVAKIADAGFDCVKVYDGLSAESLAAVQEAAAERRLPVIGHVPRRVPFEVARLDDVQHLTGVAPSPPGGDLRPFPKNTVAWRQVDDARMDLIVEASKRLGIAHTPTLVAGERLRAMQDFATLRESPDAKLLPRFYRDVVWSLSEGVPVIRRLEAEDFPVLTDAGLRGLALVKRLHAAGVPIFAGTDTQNPFVVPGASLWRELGLLETAGLTPEQALAAATTVPGSFLRLPGLGRLEPGAPADLLVLREDPTRSLAALDSLEAVIADGRLYTRAQLDAQLARYREHSEGALYDALSTVLVRRALARILP